MRVGIIKCMQSLERIGFSLRIMLLNGLRRDARHHLRWRPAPQSCEDRCRVWYSSIELDVCFCMTRGDACSTSTFRLVHGSWLLLYDTIRFLLCTWNWCRSHELYDLAIEGPD